MPKGIFKRGRRPDVIERNRSQKQRDATSESWKNEIVRKNRIDKIKLITGKIKATFGHLGKRHSEETKSKIKKAIVGKHCGERHWNWKGGISPRVLNTVVYKAWKNDVFTRDLFVCRLCHVKGGDLEAHHILVWKKYPELRFEVSNGVTLCKKCHNKTKGKEETFIHIFNQLP